MISMVGEEGIEPSIREEHDFESCAYTSSATRPGCRQGSLYHTNHGLWATGIEVVMYTKSNNHDQFETCIIWRGRRCRALKR